MNIQEAKTIYCIAIDPDPIDGGAGSALWTSNQQQTDRLFQQMSIDHRRDGGRCFDFIRNGLDCCFLAHFALLNRHQRYKLYKHFIY